MEAFVPFFSGEGRAGSRDLSGIVSFGIGPPVPSIQNLTSASRGLGLTNSTDGCEVDSEYDPRAFFGTGMMSPSKRTSLNCQREGLPNQDSGIHPFSRLSEATLPHSGCQHFLASPYKKVRA